FAIRKRVHNRLHGERGDDGRLGGGERDVFEGVVASNAAPIHDLVRPDDVVIVHDPQPVGLIPALRQRGIPVIWRCHVGTETTNERTDEAWRFLRPWVEAADALVFSRAAYAPEWVPPERTMVIPPAIDPLAAKNQPLGADVAGVTDDPEGRAVLDECRVRWEQLPSDGRSTASLVSLPMSDIEQNGAIVNALQRHATVVAQKSIREGFGLTVAEAMWKGT